MLQRIASVLGTSMGRSYGRLVQALSDGMHIETLGAGPALALIHGWAMHGGLFAPLVERLAAHYTLHLVDLPGHGHAHADASALDPAPIATELVARVPGAVWLGWSLGGQFALRAALDHPGHVRGLVMVASSPRFVRGDDWPHGVEAQVHHIGIPDRFIEHGSREDCLVMAGIDAPGIENQVQRIWADHRPSRPAVASRVS